MFAETEEAAYIDSDDEDIQPSERSVEMSENVFCFDCCRSVLILVLLLHIVKTLFSNKMPRVTCVRRLLNPDPVTEIEEAIASARSSQGHETFDDTYLTELCVKRKYMGHRNARYSPFLTLSLFYITFVPHTHTLSLGY